MPNNEIQWYSVYEFRDTLVPGLFVGGLNISGTEHEASQLICRNVWDLKVRVVYHLNRHAPRHVTGLHYRQAF